jgi:hypothetical protein
VTATIGTTTATATVPPLLSPLLLELLPPPCSPAVADADVDEDERVGVVAPAGVVGVAVDVMTTTLVDPFSVLVMKEVTGEGVAGVVGACVTVLDC